jgi:K+-sensing histidine kinase KdpD
LNKHITSNVFTFSTLLASSVHDLKNVLSSVLESLDWLSNNINNLNDEQANEFTKTSQLIAQANSELMELLCFYKFENDQYLISSLEHNVAECLEFQMLFISSLVKRGQITVTVNFDEELMWRFDQTLVNTAIRNAAMNALKYAKKQIKLSARVEHGLLKLQVADDGNGYPSSMLGRVEEYVGNIDLNTNSTGLGLYFAEKVAKMHIVNKQQGYLELTNDNILGGAAFNLYLP